MDESFLISLRHEGQPTQAEYDEYGLPCVTTLKLPSLTGNCLGQQSKVSDCGCHVSTMANDVPGNSDSHGWLKLEDLVRQIVLMSEFPCLSC
jgi:hypothetical protein